MPLEVKASIAIAGLAAVVVFLSWLSRQFEE